MREADHIQNKHNLVLASNYPCWLLVSSQFFLYFRWIILSQWVRLCFVHFVSICFQISHDTVSIMILLIPFSNSKSIFVSIRGLDSARSHPGCLIREGLDWAIQFLSQWNPSWLMHSCIQSFCISLMKSEYVLILCKKHDWSLHPDLQAN